jgi:predicted nucleotidyltransferase
MEIKTKSKEIGEIAQRYSLDLVVLFGSQATGRTHPRSDVDLGYTAPQLLDLTARFKIETDITQLLGRTDIEFVDLQRVSPTMKKIVADEGIVLYERLPGTFVSFCVYAFKLYVETRSLRESRYQSLRHFIYGTA